MPPTRGKMSREERATRREAWVARWRALAAPFYHRYIWVAAYGSLVHDAEEAREAEAARPAEGEPPFDPVWSLGADNPWHGLGRMHLARGRPEVAVRHLERAACGCDAGACVTCAIRAAVPLGEALLATGDRPGACRAWASVLARWGTAVRRSVSAKRARELAANAKCDAP
jgi:hypothetical protein